MADQDILIKFNTDTSALQQAQQELEKIQGKQGLGGVADAGNKAAAGVEAAANSTKHYADELGEVSSETKGAIQSTDQLAQSAQQVSTKAGAAAKSTSILTVAVKGLTQALKGFIVGAILGFITSLITNWRKWGEVIGLVNTDLKKSQERIDAVTKAIEENNKARAANERWLRASGKAEKDILESRKEQIKTDRDLALTEVARLQRLQRQQVLLAESFKSNNRNTAAISAAEKKAAEYGKQIEELNVLLKTFDTEIKETENDIVELTTSTKELDDAGEDAAKTIETLAQRIERLRLASAAGLQQGSAGGGGGAIKEIESLTDRIRRLREESDRANKQVGGGGAPADSTGGIGRIIPGEEELDRLGLAIEGLQAVSNILSGIAERRAAAFDAQISDLERLRDAELKNTELSASQRERIEERYQKKIARLKTQQAKAQRRADITQAIISTSLAILSIFTQTGVPFIAKGIQAGIVGALGAAQVALIASQPLPKFRKGGAVKGARHEQGGVVIEAEGGEHVIRREAVSKYGSDFIEKINKMQLPTSIKMAELPAGLIANVMNHAGLDHEKLGKVIGEQLSKQPKVSIAMDESGFTKYIQQGSYKAQYANRKFRAG